ncbi:MAG TPA: TIGR04053 family radical SAM/SPASM domain-containing protein [Candidatus Angelobacter sp.]|nr:TIGR04053 family radical SAM/SPASM domain-containing protein [Candidatus Angelobacter sp.]
MFWETTRACQLACKHCRASATPGALPGELTHDEGIAFIDSIAGFGRPHPILVLTGGDCLLRPDIFELVDHATSLGIPTALSPSVTPMLTPEAIDRIVASGVKAVSISLDGATAATHEGVRGIPGHFPATVAAIRALKLAGLTVQINTTVMAGNVHEMPDIAALLGAMGVDIWEVFFLVHVGRGVAEGALSPAEHEDVCHLLYDASQYGFIVRTVEAPFFRRVVAGRRDGGPAPDTDLYRELSGRMHELMGPGTHRASAHTAATRDGKGIVFVAHDGDVYPAGFLPLRLGNVRETPLADIYRDHPDLLAIRAATFSGQCGVCTFADMCGGSRARAWAATGDVLAEDPACLLVAEATSVTPVVGGAR